AEYMHREAFDLADRYGKDQFLLIRKLGTDRLPDFFGLKSRCDAFLSRMRGVPENLIDRLLYAAGRLLPDHLPRRMRDWRRRFEHHLILKVSHKDASEAETLLGQWRREGQADYFLCTPDEGTKAYLHRFVTAGAAVRYQAVHPRETSGIVALDIALRRNDMDWFERLSPALAGRLRHRIYYGHFLCHVLHQDYIANAGEDCADIKAQMLVQLKARGARYPAEHNVGNQYVAEPQLAGFYRRLDPGNRFNAGIGGMSRWRNYAGSSPA
ncbi:MAG: D-lactate dehydrogenase, partial [Asticcacaulis sp.]